MKGWIPNGWPRVTPRLFVERPEACVAFLQHVFAASADVTENGPAVVSVGDSKILIGKSRPRDATHTSLYVYVPDVDAAYERALSLGASVIEEPRDLPYGDRRAMVRDPWGNDWQIATYRAQRAS